MATKATFLHAPEPAIIGALHLPDFSTARATSMAFLEDYVLTNARVFAEAGFPALMLQDETRKVGPADQVTVAATAVLGRAIRREFPRMDLGIIVQAHDAEAPIAIAHAADASFVRLKIFVGAAMTMEGPRNGLAVAASTYRHDIRRDDIAICADVFDRTCVPTIDVPIEAAAKGAASNGADALILTGASFAESLDRVRRVRTADAGRPLLIGGSVTEANIGETLAMADGAVVSTSLMRGDVGADELLRWDAGKARRFMDRARSLRRPA